MIRRMKTGDESFGDIIALEINVTAATKVSRYPQIRLRVGYNQPSTRQARIDRHSAILVSREAA